MDRELTEVPDLKDGLPVFVLRMLPRELGCLDDVLTDERVLPPEVFLV